jgi:hypothetical protein
MVLFHAVWAGESFFRSYLSLLVTRSIRDLGDSTGERTELRGGGI